MPKLSVLIVEDEKLQAKKLAFLIEEMGYELREVAASASEAFLLYKATNPDVVLIDIKLEGPSDGISLAARINEDDSVPIIYITSYSDSATLKRAAETAHYAFLVKPINISTLQAAIELSIIKCNLPEQSASPGDRNEWGNDIMINNCLFVKVGDYLKKIEVNDLIYLQASSNNYIDVYTKENKYTVRTSLQDVEAKLPEAHFIRVHRSYIINTSHMDNINEKANSLTILDNIIPIGKTHKKNLIQRLKLL